MRSTGRGLRARASKEYRPFTTRDRFFHAREYAHCLTSGDMSGLTMLNERALKEVEALLANISPVRALGAMAPLT
jgi:hypothetical protein